MPLKYGLLVSVQTVTTSNPAYDIGVYCINIILDTFI